MEDKLNALVNGNKPENRTKWAMEWQKQGKKVLGLLCNYVPEEIISAAGILPWRITGTWGEATPNAALYRPHMTCRYCSHVLESVLTGDLDFLDGVAVTQVDDDFKRLWDVLHYIGKPPFQYIMYLPHTISETTLRMWRKSVAEFKEAIEEFVGVKITDDKLFHQIEVYNTMRSLLKRIYEMRKRDVPPLTGVEVLGITTAARIMPKDEFNRELTSLLPYLENRSAKIKTSSTRVLVSSEYLDNPGYIDIIEDSGAVVVMDELDTGSKYFWNAVENSKDDPLELLANRYMDRPGTSRMGNWNDQTGQVVGWAREFDTKGIVELRQLYSLPLDYRFFFMKNKLKAADIPYLSLGREYHLSHVGMLRTRIEAFIEMIQ